MTVAYKGSPLDVQQKLRRVIEVWRNRQIFELRIQEAIEASADGTTTKNPFPVPY